jgi:hypothetical protein
MAGGWCNMAPKMSGDLQRSECPDRNSTGNDKEVRGVFGLASGW